jgi:hypothetical protein
VSSQPKTKQAIASIGRVLSRDEMLGMVAQGATQRQLAKVASDRLGKEVSVYYLHRYLHNTAEDTEAYNAARLIAAQHYADQVAETVERVTNGSMDPGSAKVVQSGAMWLASRMSPKDWGDRIAVDQTITDLTTLHLESMRDRLRTVTTQEKTAVAES